jgi:Tfp pilus assembly protein PilN
MLHTLHCTVLTPKAYAHTVFRTVLTQALSTLGKAQQHAVTEMEEKHQAAAKRAKSQIDRVVKSA